MKDEALGHVYWQLSWVNINYREIDVVAEETQGLVRKTRLGRVRRLCIQCWTG
jgi:hypothetical protein